MLEADLSAAQQLLEDARKIKADVKKTGYDFVKIELDLTKTFAERAFTLFATDPEQAQLRALAATEAYQTAKQLLPKVGTAAQRDELAANIDELTPVIERLATLS